MEVATGPEPVIDSFSATIAALSFALASLSDDIASLLIQPFIELVKQVGKGRFRMPLPHCQVLQRPPEWLTAGQADDPAILQKANGLGEAFDEILDGNIPIDR